MESSLTLLDKPFSVNLKLLLRPEAAATAMLHSVASVVTAFGVEKVKVRVGLFGEKDSP